MGVKINRYRRVGVFFVLVVETWKGVADFVFVWVIVVVMLWLGFLFLVLVMCLSSHYYLFIVRK